jgi:CHAT domain-containing protein
MRLAILILLFQFLYHFAQAQTDPVIQEINRFHIAADYTSERKILEPSIQNLLQKNDTINLLQLLLNKADIMRDCGGVNLALEYLHEVERNYSPVFDQNRKLRISYFISETRCYQLLGKWSRIKEHLDSINEELKIESDPLFVALKEQLWTLYYAGTADWQKMLEYSDSSLLHSKSISDQALYLLANAYYLKALCLLHFNNKSLESAKLYLDSALYCISQQPIQNLQTKSFIMQRYGLYYQLKVRQYGELSDYHSSVSAYLESISLQKIYGNPARIAFRYNCLGGLNNDIGYREKNSSYAEEALKFFHEAQKVNIFGYAGKSIYDIPEMQPAYNDYQAQIYLPNIIQSLMRKYHNSPNNKDLETLFELSIYNVKYYMKTLQENTNEKTESLFYNTYDQTLGNDLYSTSVELYKKTGDSKYLKEGFYYASLTKYSSLLSQDITLPAEESSRIDLNLDLDSTLSIERQIIRKNFNYIFNKPDFEFWKEFISDSTVFLDYFYNFFNGKLSAIVVSKDTFSVINCLPIDSCRALLKNLNDAIQLQNTEKYEKNAFQLYKGLIPDNLQLYKNIIISPLYDNTTIPFEALVDSVSNATDFRSLSYLIKKYSFRYIFNAHFVQKRPAASEGLLIIAPDFKKDSLLSNLPFTSAFAETLSERKKSTPLLGRDASQENILKSMSQKRVIHVSSHMIYDPANTDKTYIATSHLNNNNFEGINYYQIIRCQVDADLVVLNGCRSNIGKLLSGDGFLSFSKAFTKAGAHSVIATIRSIDDKSSAEIMDFFYSGLDEGLKKSSALRQAKIKYLDNCQVSEQANPYYWNGYVYFGEDGPLQIEDKNTSLIWIFACLPLLIALGLWLVKRKPH